MRILPLLINLFVATSIALTTPHRRQAKVFTLTAKKSPGIKRDFHKEMAAARRKWGTRNIPTAVSLGNEDGVVEVEPAESDSSYIADISIGDPPQTVKLSMDTGSGDLWTQSSDTIYLRNLMGPWPPQYKANLSRTARRIPGIEWNAGYLDGSGASGIVYLDTLHLGGFEVQDMAIESAKYISRGMEMDSTISGVLGLAKSMPSHVFPNSTPTLLEKLRPLLKHPFISVDLHQDATGYFEFGDFDQTKAEGNITWVESVPNSPYWDIFLDLTRWEGSLNNPWHKYGFNATIDSGTTLLFLPPTLATAYWYDVPEMRVDPRASNAFTFPCEFGDQLPDLLFKLPNTEHQLRIPGSYLNFGPLAADPKYCWGGMQSAQDLNSIIIGDMALRALYVVFDLETQRVGLANKKL